MITFQGRKSNALRDRYPSDITDEQWQRIKPYVSGIMNGLTDVDRREMINALAYMWRTRIGIRFLPHDFPPKKTVMEFLSQMAGRGIRGAVSGIVTGRAKQ